MRPVALWGALVLTATAAARGAEAEPPPAPVFPGHPAVATYTKEIAFDGSLARLGDGAAAAGGGFALGAFYAPWLSVAGAVDGGFYLRDPRQYFDARGVARLGWPKPVGPFFFYAALGVDVFFVERVAGSHAFSEAFGLTGGIGAFANLTDQLRLRLEARDEWLVANADGLDHNLFVTLSFVTLFR